MNYFHNTLFTFVRDHRIRTIYWNNTEIMVDLQFKYFTQISKKIIKVCSKYHQLQTFWWWLQMPSSLCDIRSIYHGEYSVWNKKAWIFSHSAKPLYSAWTSDFETKQINWRLESSQSLGCENKNLGEVVFWCFMTSQHVAAFHILYERSHCHIRRLWCHTKGSNI